VRFYAIDAAVDVVFQQRLLLERPHLVVAQVHDAVGAAHAGDEHGDGIGAVGMPEDHLFEVDVGDDVAVPDDEILAAGDLHARLQRVQCAQGLVFHVVRDLYALVFAAVARLDHLALVARQQDDLGDPGGREIEDLLIQYRTVILYLDERGWRNIRIRLEPLSEAAAENHTDHKNHQAVNINAINYLVSSLLPLFKNFIRPIK